MKTILNLLKKFWLSIIFIVVLLVIQANLDLTMPDYTASIINTGIQSSGIEETIPKVMSKTLYENISEFDENQEILEKNYERINKENHPNLVSEYPLLEKEDLYILKEDATEDSLEKLNLSYLFLGMLTYNKEMIGTEVDVLSVLPSMSKEQKSGLLQEFQNKIKEYDESMLDQMSSSFVRLDYQSMGIDLNQKQMSYIISKGIVMILLALGLMIVSVVVGFLSSRCATKFASNLRRTVVQKVMSFSTQEFKEFSIASLITRSTNDIQQIQMVLVMFLRMLIYAPILGVGAFVKVIKSPLNWVLGLGIGSITIIIIILFIFVLPKFKMIQKLIDKLNLVSRERLNGVPVIRAFGTYEYEEQKFDKANRNLVNTICFADKAMGIMMPTIMFIMNGVSILIIYAGASLIDAGSIQVGTLMAFITYSMQAIFSFLMISMASIMLPRAWVSLKRIAEILDTKNSITDSENPKPFNKIKGELEFKNVTFKYPDADEEILEDISFKATMGTTTAFIGSTGSGKSTLVNLIPRFFDVTSGEVLIDGKNIKDVSLKELRDKIGFVPQKGNLFSGTIEDNVLFSNEKKDKKLLQEACDVACATEFINNLPGKYNYEIAQGGTNVSGGQRQRLSIARAIASKPEFFVFDDSFSALDYKTDVQVRKNLKEYTKDATIFIVAQRISSVLTADQIIVLDKGKIVGKGTHKELMKTCQIYKEIAMSQLKESELHA